MAVDVQDSPQEKADLPDTERSVKSTLRKLIPLSIVLGIIASIIEVLVAPTQKIIIATAIAVLAISSFAAYSFSGSPTRNRWARLLFIGGVIFSSAMLTFLVTREASPDATISITSPAENTSGGPTDITRLLSSDHELKVSGSVSGIKDGETIWVANIPDWAVEGDIAKSPMYPAFGPCAIESAGEWSCDRVFLGEAGLYHIIALRVTSNGARTLVSYQQEAYRCGDKPRKECDPKKGFFPQLPPFDGAEIAVDRLVRF
jgi:hypothetical protein